MDSGWACALPSRRISRIVEKPYRGVEKGTFQRNYVKDHLGTGSGVLDAQDARLRQDRARTWDALFGLALFFEHNWLRTHPALGQASIVPADDATSGARQR